MPPALQERGRHQIEQNPANRTHHVCDPVPHVAVTAGNGPLLKIEGLRTWFPIRRGVLRRGGDETMYQNVDEAVATDIVRSHIRNHEPVEANVLDTSVAKSSAGRSQGHWAP